MYMKIKYVLYGLAFYGGYALVRDFSLVSAYSKVKEQFSSFKDAIENKNDNNNNNLNMAYEDSTSN